MGKNTDTVCDHLSSAAQHVVPDYPEDGRLNEDDGRWTVAKVLCPGAVIRRQEGVTIILVANIGNVSDYDTLEYESTNTSWAF
jgi:hypothetical protein